MQIASPQVMVDIDRDRAVSLGVTPQQVQDALFSAYGSAPGIGDLRARQSVFRDPGGAAAISANARGAFEALPARPASNALVPLESVVRPRRADRPAVHQPLRPIARGNHFLQSAPGIFAGPGGGAGGRHHPRDAHAGHHRRELPGHRQGVPEFVRESIDPAAGGDPGDLHRARRAVRELHSPHHDSLRAALGGLRRAADAGASSTSSSTSTPSSASSCCSAW